jgi:tape measure domain-containing protein
MSSPLEDFIISLGFDTSKLKGQIDTVHKSLGKLAQVADTKRVKAGLTTEKKIADNTVKVAKETAKKKERIATDAEKKEVVRRQKVAKLDKETRRKATIRIARNVVAEHDRSVSGPSNMSQRLERLVKTNASMAQMKAFTEDVRGRNVDTRNRMKQEGSLKSFDSASSSAADLQMLKSRTAIESMAKQMAVLGMNPDAVKAASVSAKTLDDLKKLQIQTQAAIRDHKIQNKPQRGGVNKPPVVKLDKGEISKLFSQMDQQGAFNKFSQQQRERITSNAMQQQTTRGAASYLKTAQGLNRYGGMQGGQRQINMGISGATVDTLRSAKVELGKMSAEMNRLQRNSIGAAAAMGSLQDSTRNMVREYASLYAVMAGTVYAKEQVKALDSMNASVLAVSTDSKEAGQTIEYLKDTIIKNGLSLKETTKDFVKLRAAMGDKYSLDQTKQAFESLTKVGVIFQLSQDDMTGTVRALSQMFSKAGIQAQELKEQLGDRMPIAMRALEKSTGKTAKELFKMMELGQLKEEYILPFIAAMEKLVNVNGAYEASLKKLSVVENSLKAAFSVRLAEKLDEGGFTKGLIEFYSSLTEGIMENGETLKELGKIYGRIFKGLAELFRALTPIIESTVRAIGTVTDLLAWFANNKGAAAIAGIGAMALGLSKAAKAAGGLGAALAIALRSPMVMLMTLVGLIDEVRAFFDENVHGLMDDKSLSVEEQKMIHAKRRVNFGMDSEKDREYLKSKGVDTSSSGIMQTIQSVVPFASVMANTQVAVSNLNSWLERTYNEGNSKSDKLPATVNFNITSTDPIEAGKEVKKALDNTFSLQMMGGF